MADRPTPIKYSAETEGGLLGEYFNRKQRGSSGRIATAESVVLVDCVGDNELAAGIQIACEVEEINKVQVQEAPPGTLVTPPVVGILEWGNDGATVSAEFDFVNGTILSVAAASVRLRAQYEIPPQQPFPVVLRAHVGYFPKPAGPAQRSFSATVAAGSDVAFPVPKFARRVRLVRSPLVSARLNVLSLFPLGTVAQYGPTVDPVLDLPLPNGSRLVAVSNLGADPAVLSVVFDLWI
jgi:hypothetical protein